MDRALVAVLGGAVGCGALLGLAVLKNERTFTTRLYAESPVVVETAPARRKPEPSPPSLPAPVALEAATPSAPASRHARHHGAPARPAPGARHSSAPHDIR